MRSIYHDKATGDSILQKSFCAYMDILGFSDKILRNDLDFFNSYLDVLHEELKYLEDMHDLSGKNEFKNFELKIFTDNFVFGHPWYDEYGESELGNIFDVLSHIQFTFTKSNIFIRGAVSLSDLFMDSNVVLGPGIIESYKLESEKAIYPRIILSEQVSSVVNKHIGFYADKQGSLQNEEYLIDFDGYYFINYLLVLLRDRERNQEFVVKELSLHKTVIVENLEATKDAFRVFEKYAWVANYHNYFCDTFLLVEYPDIVLSDVKIAEELYSRDISRIVE